MNESVKGRGLLNKTTIYPLNNKSAYCRDTYTCTPSENFVYANKTNASNVDFEILTKSAKNILPGRHDICPKKLQNKRFWGQNFTPNSA